LCIHRYINGSIGWWRRFLRRNFCYSIGFSMNSWPSDRVIINQLSRLEHQISLKESNLHSQWKKLKQQILERKRWKNDQK
jgi:protein involved in sex pheromone biosynthesis